MEENRTPEQIRKEAKRLYDIAYYKRNADWIRQKGRQAYWRKKLGAELADGFDGLINVKN
jgi:hypothetical protein